MLKTSAISLETFFVDAFNKSTIDNDRKILLLKITEAIKKEYLKNKVVNLNFICTHNSRRSQLGQVWGFYAAHYFKLNINAFSGGTEVTSFYRNTVKTLQKAGFEFHLKDFSHINPIYQITLNGTKKSILGYSKFYSDSINLAPFITITTCDKAAKNCPIISTSNYRFHLPFEDPKFADGTPIQEKTYLQTSQQIAAEIYFIFAEVKKLLQ